MENSVAIVMAGGLGARLWPRSNEKSPKQFIHLSGEGTMIQNTVNRLKKLFKIENIYVVTSKNMKSIVAEQLKDLPKDNIIPEPFIRNTAPCLALSAVYLDGKVSGDTIMAVFPADHVIFNEGEFQESVKTSVQAARETKGIVTIGIKPTRPEKSFGYIQVKEEVNEEIKDLYEKGLRKSSNFAEKPDKETAKRLIESGDFLWNSGIFVWRIDTFWQAMKKYWPEDTNIFQLLLDSKDTVLFQENVEQTYRQISSLSIDYAILEKAKNVYTVQSSFRWSDIGNWDEHYRLSMKDARNNVIEGDVIPINSKNCMVLAQEKLIGLVGVEDLFIIDSEDAILICKKGRSDESMEIVDFLRRKNVNRFL